MNARGSGAGQPAGWYSMTRAGVGRSLNRGSVRIVHSPPSMSIFTRSASAIGGRTSRAGWSGAPAVICDSAKPPVANGSSVSSAAAMTWTTCHCGVVAEVRRRSAALAGSASTEVSSVGSSSEKAQAPNRPMWPPRSSTRGCEGSTALTSGGTR